MINSYFKSTVTRPTNLSSYSSSRLTVQRSLLVQKQRKYKLFIILISRATYRQLRDCFEQIKITNQRTLQCLSRMVVFSEKNLNLSVYLSFEKMKGAADRNRKEERFLKNVFNLLQRMEKYKLKQCFNKLVLHSSRTTRNIIDNLNYQRAPNFQRKLAMLIKRKKKDTFVTMVAWARFIRSYSKVRVISVIHHRFQKQLKQQFFTRLTRFLLARNNRNTIQREVGDLRTQLQDMTAQLENKKDNIQRLEEELTQIKIEQSNMSSYQNLSYGEYNNDRSKRGPIKTFSQKKISFNQRSIGNKSVNDSGDGLSLNDMSIGSILGNLNKSRTGSMSKFDQNADCSCGYKSRYQKYKSLSQSLKNQLQIVKEELQVAKDLNEHFTNQIKQYLTGDMGDGDYQKLKKQHKAIQEERDQLREKVFKYQKHIANLKSEFKVKMEELYRKVRKDNL